MASALAACGLLLLCASPAAGATFTVTNGADTSTTGTLRKAIEDAEANGNPGTVDEIPITFTGNIDVTAFLPTITEPVTIDGPGASSLHVRRSPSATTGFGLFDVNPGAGATVTIRDLTITGARATNFSGGAIGMRGAGTLIVDSVVFSDNQIAGNGSGGAIHFDQGFTSIRNSTLSGNKADFGGAIQGDQFGMVGGEGELVNSTLTGNEATSFGGAIQMGSDIAQITILSSTIQGNTADSDGTNTEGGGAIASGGSEAGVFNIANTVFAGNESGGTSPVANDCSGPLTSFGYNLRESADPACSGFTATGDIVGNPMLGGLSTTAGQTPTFPLLAGSAAIDAGNPASPGSGTFPTCPGTDQRGLARGGSNGRCDIGAFEVQVPAPAGPAPPAGPTITGRRAKAIKKCKKKFPKGPKRKKCIKRAKRLPV